jgi:hypothetical protein
MQLSCLIDNEAAWRAFWCGRLVDDEVMCPTMEWCGGSPGATLSDGSGEYSPAGHLIVDEGGERRERKLGVPAAHRRREMWLWGLGPCALSEKGL